MIPLSDNPPVVHDSIPALEQGHEQTKTISIPVVGIDFGSGTEMEVIGKD